MTKNITNTEHKLLVSDYSNKQGLPNNLDFHMPKNLTPEEQKDIETTMLIMNKLVSLIEIEDNAENKKKCSNLLENL